MPNEQETESIHAQVNAINYQYCRFFNKCQNASLKWQNKKQKQARTKSISTVMRKARQRLLLKTLEHHLKSDSRSISSSLDQKENPKQTVIFRITKRYKNNDLLFNNTRWCKQKQLKYCVIIALFAQKLSSKKNFFTCKLDFFFLKGPY